MGAWLCTHSEWKRFPTSGAPAPTADRTKLSRRLGLIFTMKLNFSHLQISRRNECLLPGKKGKHEQNVIKTTHFYPGFGYRSCFFSLRKLFPLPAQDRLNGMIITVCKIGNIIPFIKINKSPNTTFRIRDPSLRNQHICNSRGAWWAPRERWGAGPQAWGRAARRAGSPVQGPPPKPAVVGQQTVSRKPC